MDLHSGLPFWIIKNELFNYYNPLSKNHKTEVAVIGSGITGSLIAHELCKAGISCSVFDKRTIATGSTAASTAQLQYEIDVPLCKMTEMVGEDFASRAYQARLESIKDVVKVLKEANVNADYKPLSSVWLASYKKDVKLLEAEFEIREKHGLPVQFLSDKEVWKQHHIQAPAAPKNEVSAQMDCYAA